MRQTPVANAGVGVPQLDGVIVTSGRQQYLFSQRVVDHRVITVGSYRTT